MLIFEPKHYTSLCAKGGDTVYDYFTGVYVGVIAEIDDVDETILVDCPHNNEEWWYRSDGTHRDDIFSYDDIVLLDKFNWNRPIHPVMPPHHNRIKLC